MNEKVKEFIDAKIAEQQKEYENEKSQTLVALGLFEKVYSDNNQYSDEFSFYDTSVNKYYKKVGIDISDEEYQKIKKYSKADNSFRKSNPIATLLSVIAVLIFIAGFIGGIVMGNAVTEYSWEFSWGTAFICWLGSFFSGSTILGFAEIIWLLNDIKNK